ncbi:MAG TPA: peptidase M16 [Sulfurivirga caldicuralii]|nr:peptidase M16 [Sulfurivirga caldicuralii]
MHAFATFEAIRSQRIDSLNLTVEAYRHRMTGAQHFHLHNDDPHNVFMVAFRTVPMDSTGVAHILEHTVLCGSERFPVRDPFFMMIRRSLNSFMNAFTAADWTAYPFATENRKDFQNLLEVYLDAAFFPNLHPLDFAQEGHRLEFEPWDDPDGELVRKGVVYNEMKGAMSSPTAALWQAFSAAIFPTTTYHYNSGGDPQEIPNLTHRQLVAFHKAHYHPSNAIFLTYGDIPAAEHQANFEKRVLHRFTDRVPVAKVDREKRYIAPVRTRETYALEEADTRNKTHIVVGWLLGENRDPMEVLTANLVTMVLLDNSASPLRKALEQTDLAAAPSPLCGLEDDTREMVFVAGVEGSEAEHADAIEALIDGVLQEVVEQGVDQQMVEAMLHQLELMQREITGDGYPYGLSLMLGTLAAPLHGGDLVALLDLDPALDKLREQVKNPRFIPQWIERWLLRNPHKVRLVMEPDPDKRARDEAAEKNALAALKAKMTAEEKDAIIAQADALKLRQAQQDDPDILPKVTKEDIPREIKVIKGKSDNLDNLPLTYYVRGTNGLVYESLIVDLPDLAPNEQAAMPVFNGVLTEVGSAGRDYLQTQALAAAVTGGISARAQVREHLLKPDLIHGHFILSGKALNRNHAHLAQLMEEQLISPRFDEHGRIRDLVSQMRVGLEHGITRAGHSYAMGAAVQHFTPASRWAFERSGLKGVQTFKALDERIREDNDALEGLAATLSDIQRKLLHAPKQALLVADSKGLEPARHGLAEQWQPLAQSEQVGDTLSVQADGQPVQQAWVTSTQVNFCATAFPAVMPGHEDAPLLQLLAHILRNGFLHTRIREQGGAYGGGATYHATAGALVFYSYRDPRLLETFADFEAALAWVCSSEASEAHVEEAILNVIAAMDKPGSPAGEAKKAFYQQLYGYTPAVRQRIRDTILAADLEQIRTVAEKYLQTDKASKAVLTHQDGAKVLADAGFEVITL